jgi:hypothetical protein
VNGDHAPSLHTSRVAAAPRGAAAAGVSQTVADTAPVARARIVTISVSVMLGV